MTTNLPPLPTSSSNLPVIAEVKPALELTGPKFVARDHLTEVQRKEVEAYARNLLASKDLSVTFFVKMIEDFGLADVPSMDAILDNIRNIDSGEVGERLLSSTDTIRHLNKKLPKFNPRFVEKFNQGLAKAEEIVDTVKWVAREIEKALSRYQTNLTLMNENESVLNSKAQFMIEAVVRSDQTREEIEGRTDKLMILSAMLEYFQEMLSARLEEVTEALKLDANNPELNKEKERLMSIAPLSLTRLGSIKPMISMSNMSMERAIGQRNANAINAIKLLDFTQVAIPQWKNDVVAQLNALQSQAAAIALSEATRFMNEQSVASAEAYEEQVRMSSELLSKMMVSIDTMRRVSQSIITAGESLKAGLEKAERETAQASREVQRSDVEIKEAKNKMAEDFQRILDSAVTS